jgi:hypothetical protein
VGSYKVKLYLIIAASIMAGLVATAGAAAASFIFLVAVSFSSSMLHVIFNSVLGPILILAGLAWTFWKTVLLSYRCLVRYFW